MRNILESEEIFEAYAVIDLCYYGLEKLNMELGKPRSVLETEIDRVTGYTKAKTEESIDTAIELLKQIIEAKKKIEADYSKDAEMLDKIRLIKIK